MWRATWEQIKFVIWAYFHPFQNLKRIRENEKRKDSSALP